MGLDIVELIVTVEDVFQMNIADEEANSVSTVGDLHNLVLSKLGDSKSGLSNLDEVGDSKKEDVWETLCRVIITQTHVDRERITPDARILDDLGIG